MRFGEGCLSSTGTSFFVILLPTKGNVEYLPYTKANKLSKPYYYTKQTPFSGRTDHCREQFRFRERRRRTAGYIFNLRILTEIPPAAPSISRRSLIVFGRMCCAYEILTPYKASQSDPWVAPYKSIVGVRQNRLHSPTVFIFLEKNVRCFMWFRVVVARWTITNLRFADDVDLVAQGRETSNNNTMARNQQ